MRKRNVSRKTLIISGGVLLLAVIALFLWAPWHTAPSKNTAAVTPNFQALLPQNTSIDKLGGWQKLTPPDGTPVYIYSDSIDKVTISVSQQPLPDSLKDNSGAKLAEMAKSYNATKVINAGTTKVYIGTNAAGPQSVIFTKNNVLVLIKSTATVKDVSWTSYINSLK